MPLAGGEAGAEPGFDWGGEAQAVIGGPKVLPQAAIGARYTRDVEPRIQTIQIAHFMLTLKTENGLED